MEDPRIILMAETGADIPPEIAQRYNIQIVPMHVTFGSDTRDDGSFPPEEVCEFYDRTGVLPKTSGSVPEDFIKCFDHIHTKWPNAQILYLAYSAATTCSYQSAQIAAEGRDYITSIDTKMVSVGQGAIVVRMARLLEAHPEWTVAEAVEAAQDLMDRARFAFIPDDLEYLRAGGRVSNAVALVGRVLGIHPLIELLNGQLIATKKLRGKLLSIGPKLLADYAEREDLDREELWIVRAPGFTDELHSAMAESAKTCGFQKVNWLQTGGVITAHGGKGAFGVAGFTKKK